MHIIATSTKEDLIQLGTFFDSLNEVIHEYTSPYKDSDAFVRIVKPLPIVGWMALGNIGDKQKSFVVNNGMVEVTCEGNKMLVVSINKKFTLETWKLKNVIHKNKKNSLSITKCEMLK